MKGTIDSIKENCYGNLTYGFITSKEESEHIFFHKSNLKNCNIIQLHSGDDVEFDVKEVEKGFEAINIRLEANENNIFDRNKSASYPTPGVHSSAKKNIATFFGTNSDERTIINKFQKIFYITNAGTIKIGESNYNYCLIKPTEYYINTFHLKREIIVIFSDYINFEPRDNDAYESIHKKIGAQTRLERAMHLLIHNDNNVEEKMKVYLCDNTRKQIIIPFSFQEILSSSFNEELVQNRFKEWLFDVDMFSDVQPITDEAFFFGRRDFINDITNNCKNGTNSGVFGLRRSGKTSVLYAVQRQLESMGEPVYQYVFIPCNTLQTMNWKKSLYYIIQEIYKKVMNFPLSTTEKEYDNGSTQIIFENDLSAVIESLERPLTLMFDEIEHITNFSAKKEDGLFGADDFVYFWNTIKGFYSKYPKRMSILIAGTNPMINEISMIKSSPNPMYATLAATNQGTYLRPFNFQETKNMVNTLGGYMGLRFSDDMISKLKEDCGGHPYLIRMTCSYINRFIKNEHLKRPIKITKAIYDKAIPEFECSQEAESFFKMILSILISDYQTEYNTLKLLATEGDRIISQTKTDQELNHLIGYGLVENNQKNFCIRYNTVDRFLKGTYKFERTGLTVEEQKEEINFRLGNAEISLRKFIKRTLLTLEGKDKATERIITAMEHNRAVTECMLDKAKSLTYNQLFDPSVNNGLFFSVLSQVIKENMNIFSVAFEENTEADIRYHLTVLNDSRRCPYHSYEENSEQWTDENFANFRKSIEWLENILKKFD